MNMNALTGSTLKTDVTGYDQTRLTEQSGFVVLNPAAGHSNPEEIKTILQSSLDGGQYDLHETTGEESLADVVQTAVSQKAYNWVAAIGGDGTVSQVANGLLGTEIPLAIIPAGTANVLARTLGIPQEVEAACRLLGDTSAVCHIDAIQLADQTFFLHVGVGLESITMQKTSAAQKKRWGVAAYLGTAVKEMFGWQPHHFKLKVDGQPVEVQASELVIANAGKIGLFDLEWQKAIDPHDGRLDLAIVRARSLADYARLVWAILRNQQRQSAHIQFYRIQNELRIDADRLLPFHGDGEILDVKIPVTAVVVPRVLPVMVPSTESKGLK